MQNIPYVNLAAQHRGLKEKMLNAIGQIIDQGNFVMGKEVTELEKAFANYCSSRYAVAVGSGTDALILALKAVGIGRGDEVITAPNSFLASTSAIEMVGATPVFVDVCDDFNIDQNLIETVVTSRTKAILPIHLTGRPANMEKIMKVAQTYNLQVIEDAAQAAGACYNGKKVGTFGSAGCFSLHPLKNLSACGDGGIVTTNDDSIYQYLLKARNHGLRNRDECEFWSLNSRLDTIQAAILLIKLKYIDEWTDKRRKNANYYRENLEDIVEIPYERPEEYCVYQTFMIQTNKRDELQHHLSLHGIETKVHYPIPIHLQIAAAHLGYHRGDFPVTEKQSTHILSLPIYPELTEKQLDYIVNSIKSFF